MNNLEEAEKRDHRKLAKTMDLFHLQEEAPGMVFWHPNGWTIYQEIEQYIRATITRNGYQEVRTPQIVDRSLMGKIRPLGQISVKKCLHSILKIVIMRLNP